MLSGILYRRKSSTSLAGDMADTPVPRPNAGKRARPLSAFGRLSHQSSHESLNSTASSQPPPLPFVTNVPISAMSSQITPSNNSSSAAKQFQLVEAFRLHANEIEPLIQSVKRYISSGPSESAPFGSPLHLGVSLSSKPVIDRIINEFCIHNTSASDDASGLGWVNVRNSEGETPCHLAARLGRADIIGSLLNIHGVDETIRDYDGRTPGM